MSSGFDLEDGWWLARISFPVNEKGEGPVSDDDAAYYTCFGCNKLWPCDPTEHEAYKQSMLDL